jgi:hypothetical protein
MFRMITLTQWKWTRTTLLLATLAAFGLPLAALRGAREEVTPRDFIDAMQMWSIGYALLAAGVGLVVALAAWGHDHQGRHVYALSLPVARWRYALMRFGAGMLFLVLPTLALFASGLVVWFSGAIPQGLHVYALSLALRFFFAAAVSFALFFAIGSATTRTAAVILGAVAVLFLAQYVVELTGSDLNLLARLADFVFVRPGVLSVFSGRWMLIDV